MPNSMPPPRSINLAVPGVFTYLPAAGTILNAASNQMLSTTFTPTDTANFNSANASVHINVLKVTPTINWSNPGGHRSRPANRQCAA